MKKILVLIAMVAALSCASTRKSMDSWTGHSKQELILSWGPPTTISSDGNNGEVYVYSEQQYQAFTNTNWYVVKMFYIYPDGKVYSWRTRNSMIPPQQMVMSFR